MNGIIRFIRQCISVYPNYRKAGKGRLRSVRNSIRLNLEPKWLRWKLGGNPWERTRLNQLEAQVDTLFEALQAEPNLRIDYHKLKNQ